MPLERIGSYRLVELLGSGAMGEVYKATDSKLFDRVVAVKLLSEKYAGNENARSRFQNEIQYVAHLDHPNIVKIFDHGDIDGRPYFVMEYLDGVNLARFVKDEPNRTMDRCVEIARQLAEALEFAHRNNVVHRDVKPANVMLVRRGDSEQVKLVDFGIIHVETSGMTRDGTQPGTSAYSSPEQLRNDVVDHRSDLFALGIVLYELFSNVYPFDAPSEALITHYIMQREPESPRKKNAAIPAAIDALIMKLLEKDMTQRPQTAGEVAESLKQQHRKLQSKWASTDPAGYENLDEITREAVDKLVAWARQKEADGALQEAVEAFEKALRLAPDSERIQRRIPKLRHRIESERLVREHLGKAEAALASGRFPEARAHWHEAWLLSPESEDVSAMQLRIERSETAAPDDSEKRKFVDGHVARAEEALDAGRLDEARSEVVKILQRYPNEPLANFMLERILAIVIPEVDFVAYRKLTREARDLLERGQYAEARVRCVKAQALWPGDAEVLGVERDIAERVGSELAALASRVEKKLLQADDPELEPQVAQEILAKVRADVARAREFDVDAPWIAASSDDLDRIDRSVKERVARAEALLREQSEQRRKRIEMFLQRGRNQLSRADAVGNTVTTEPGPAIEAYGLARESYESVLQDEASNSEALEGCRTIEERLRALAERVDQARRNEQEISSALEAARSAVADAEVAGGHRATELGTVLASLREADVALDRVLAIAPEHAAAAALRAQVGVLRKAVLAEQAAREQAAKEQAAKEQAAKEQAAKEQAAREQAAREQAAREQAAKEQAAKDKAAKDKAAKDKVAEIQAAKKQPPKEQAAKEHAADHGKLAEFEKGLTKHQRLVGQGRLREAAEIKRILESEAASDPQLQARLAEAIPSAPAKPSRVGLFSGLAAAIVVVGIAVVLLSRARVHRTEELRLAAEQAAKDQAAKDQAAKDQAAKDQAAKDQAAKDQAAKDQAAKDQAAKDQAAKDQAANDQAAKDQAAKDQAAKDQAAKDQAAKDQAAKDQAAKDRAAKDRAAADKAAADKAAKDQAKKDEAATQDAIRLSYCLESAGSVHVGAGYQVAFSVRGRSEPVTSPRTDANGCATVDIPTTNLTDRVGPEFAIGPDDNRLEIQKPPVRSYARGDKGTLKVRLKQ